MIESTVQIMRVDDMPEVVKDLSKALLAVEDAWATVEVEKSSSLVARERVEREPHGFDGAAQADA
jgi:hypothetical protein